MKNFLVVIVALLYMSTSSGATLYIHYCMGKQAGWGFGENKSKTCGGCGMEKSEEKDNGCCKDEHKFIKSDTDQKTTETGFQLIQLIAVALPASFIEISADDFSSVTDENPISDAPSRSDGVAVYIRNCIFLI